jgi:hypothetical protein
VFAQHGKKLRVNQHNGLRRFLDETMKTKCRVFIVALLTLMWGNAYAQVDCRGTVESLSMQLDSLGTVTLSISGGPRYTYVCNIDPTVTRNGVSPTVCKTMYATLMAAKLAAKKVTMRFYDYTSCSSVPAWANAGALGWTVLLED